MESLIKAVSKIDDGYKFEKGIGCTYSVDEGAFRALAKHLGIYYDADKLKDFEEGKLFRLYAQQGHIPFAHNAITAVNPKMGVLHAKVYCMKFTKEKELPKYKVVVASANLTNADELNVYASFTGEIQGNGNNKFGNSVADFFEKHFENDGFTSLIDELRTVGFGEDCEFIDVCKETFEDIKKEGLKKVISPFLGIDLPETIIISRPDQFDMYADKYNNSQCRVLCADVYGSDNSGGKAPLPLLLHAKAYITEMNVYLGSANATKRAFDNNIEALVRIPKSDAKYLTEETWITDHTADGINVTEAQNQRQFDRDCMQITAGFSADENYYVFSAVPSGYALTLNGKRKTCNAVFERKIASAHTITLKIEDEHDHKCEIILLVSGKPLSVNADKISRDCEETLIKELFGGTAAPTDGSREKMSGKASGSQQMPKPVTLVGKLREIKNLDDLQNVRDKVSEIKDKSSGEQQDILNAFMKQTERIMNNGNK